MIIERDVGITMRDGVSIYASVYRPEKEGRGAGSGNVWTS